MIKRLKKMLVAFLILSFCFGTINTSVYAADNVWHGDGITRDVTAGKNGYTFVSYYPGRAYEMSNHMVLPKGGDTNSIPQTLVLLDASKDYTWTPDGPYVFGESNYEVLYCCDIATGYEDAKYYKRTNLEDSTYYSDAAARHIRAIVTNSYPYVSVEEMKEFLAQDGFAGAEKLTRAEIITAVQTAIWTYANDAPSIFYSRTFSIPDNTQWGKVFYDYTNEMDVWWKTGKRVFSTDETVAARINSLVQHLRGLEPVAASEDEIIVSNIEMLRAEPISLEDDLFDVSLRVVLNTAGDADDTLKLKVSSSSISESTTNTTEEYVCEVAEDNTYELKIKAKYGDTITAVVEGTQVVPKGVYLYEPENGRDMSQTLVGVGMGETDVYAEKSFVFDRDIEMGIRIYKSSSITGKPLSDITFTAYKVEETDGENISAVPTAEEIAKYQTEANKVGSVTTDEFGYGALALDEGVYLIVEEHNAEKVVEPVKPFYIVLPMDDSVNDANVDIVSIYPKNVPVPPPEDPDPDLSGGKFKILKHRIGDEEHVLKGAEFQLYRPATALDAEENISVVECGGIEFNVVPVEIDGENVVMKTGEDGTAVSPELKYGTYYLVETKAPFGYSKDESATAVNVVDNTTEVLVKIDNAPLTVLPETGGIGTTVFYVSGTLILLLGVALMMERKKEYVK